MGMLKSTGFWLAARLFLVLASAMAFQVPASGADQWTSFDFGEVRIEAPAQWEVTYQEEGEQIHLRSPDGNYTLLAFWWFPDEPLLGYDDIVAHEEIMVAGRRAMVITSEFPQLGVYGLAFLDPRRDGHQFIMNLEFQDKDFTAAANLLDRFLAGIRYGRIKGGASRTFGGEPVDQAQDTSPGAIATAPETQPETVPVGDMLIAEIGNIYAVANGPEKPVVFTMPEPVFIQSIQTYHWNHGRGRSPGTIALRSADATYGPWQASGRPGQGGVPDAYWIVEPGIILPAGRYELVDSDPGTWATNSASGNKGFVRIEYRRTETRLPSGGEAIASGTPETAVPGEIPATTARPGDPVLFDGLPDERWLPVSEAGGNYDAFARSSGGMLIVDVPAGNGWAKTGIRSAAPLVRVGDGTGARTVRFDFDAANTSAFVLALAAADGSDEWPAHDIRFAWGSEGGDEPAHATLFLRRSVVRRVATGPRAPDSITLRLDPTGVVAAILPDGTMLEATLPGGPAPEGYHVHAIAHAMAKEQPARLALRRIETGETPAAKPALTAWPDDRAEVVLFDGRLGTDWVGHGAAGGDFNRDARLDGDMLLVDVAQGSAWGNAGILSPAALVWLDGLRGDGEVTVTFELDPARTDGFALALAHPGYGGVGGNGPGKPNVTFAWHKPKDSTGALADVHFYPHGGNDFDRQEVSATPPSQVRFSIRAGEVTVSAEGMAPVTRPYDAARDGAGLRVYAYTIVPEKDAPARLALDRIVLTRKPGAAAPTPEPAPGVDPLPETVAFDGSPSPAWEPIGVAGGDFEAFARFEDGALVVEVPEGHSWGKTGLLSAEPLLKLDPRIRQTPARIELQMDPARPQNLNFALSTRKIADMWQNHRGWYTFTYIPERQVWVMGLRHSPYQEWSREVDAGWVAENWDGRLRIDVGDGWTAMEIPGGPRLYGTMGVGPYYHLHGVVQAHPPAEQKAASLTLRSITTGMVTPDGMSAADRWSLLDDETFEPGQFLETLFDDLETE